MELTREALEKTLKIHMDKMKFRLHLNSYSNADYQVRLSDHIVPDSVISKGDTVLVQIKTDRFLHALGEKAAGNPKEMIEFNDLLASNLKVIPKMFDTLAYPAIADKLAHNKETGKFKRYSDKRYNEDFPPHPYEKEISFSIDFRATAIHWKSGTILREYGKSADHAMGAVRSKIFALLADETVYKRDSNQFVRIEAHNDILFDIVAECKIFSKDELAELIQKLEEEYLS